MVTYGHSDSASLDPAACYDLGMELVYGFMAACFVTIVVVQIRKYIRETSGD